MSADAFARVAAEERRNNAALTPPQGLAGSFDAAYAHQDAYVAAVEPSAGAVAGYKLAINGLPQQMQLGLTQPASARIFGNEIYGSGTELPASSFQMLCVEPEIAAILGDGVRDIAVPKTRAEARQVVDRFHPAIELIDPRGLGMAPDLIPAAVALNIMNAGIVMGEDQVAADALDLSHMTTTLSFDGQVAAEATDNAPQHPLDAVMWLMWHLNGRGIAVEPGMVVMCGTHVPLMPAPESVGHVAVSFSGLGAVEVAITR